MSSREKNTREYGVKDPELSCQQFGGQFLALRNAIPLHGPETHGYREYNSNAVITATDHTSAKPLCMYQGAPGTPQGNSGSIRASFSGQIYQSWVHYCFESRY